uniref:Uncharacterized protein n=1 Tax=Bionectria ochroleuca TaxID=29856 RepID=A0A8H7NHG3_BIOOC
MFEFRSHGSEVKVDEHDMAALVVPEPVGIALVAVVNALGISAAASLSSREAQQLIASSPKIQASNAGRHHQITASSRDHDELYGADSMNGVTGDPALTCEVFGSSNANSFMRQVQVAVDVDVDARADFSDTREGSRGK